MNTPWYSSFALLGLLGMLLSGCARTASTQDDGDPLERYSFTDGLDKAVLTPVARTYVRITPKRVRTGVTNFFDNVGYINVIANDLLQGKIVQGVGDTARFAINSTVGIGGLFDPANRLGLVKNEEDPGQTLGRWGFAEGAYLVVPLRGSNSLRDAPDLVMSPLLNPLFYVSSVVALPVAALGAVNQRANLLEATRIRDEAALDAYSFTPEAYRQNRTYEIYDGNPPVESLEYAGDEEASELKVN